MKELTESRISEEQPYYDLEVERIKQRIKSLEGIPIFFQSFSYENEWINISDEDLRTFALAQVEADAPHPSIHGNPYNSADQIIKLIKSILPEMKNKQQFNLILHPSMYRREAKKIINYVKEKYESPLLTVIGRSPNSVTHALFYSLLYRHIVEKKAVLCVDLKDRETSSLALALAMRQFNIQLTSRNVWFPRGRQSYNMTPPEKIAIYNDKVGGILDDNKTRAWLGVSTKDRVMNSFPGNSGLDYEKLVKLHNHNALNITGELESEKINNSEHLKYIKNRIYLEAFRKKQAEYLLAV